MAWMRFRCNTNCIEDPENCISERLVIEMADAMVRHGWRDLGYHYVSLDGVSADRVCTLHQLNSLSLLMYHSPLANLAPHDLPNLLFFV